MTTPTKAVSLVFGYTDAEQAEHKEVTIGRRLTGGDLMRIGDLPESDNQTQFGLLVLQSVITRFGTLRMPVAPTVLLSLNSVDRKDLNEANNAFVRETGAGRKSEKLSASRVKLSFGLKVGETVYDVVEFGKLLTGYDELAADDFEGWRRACFLLGKQIVKLEQSEGGATLDGQVDAEVFETADASDIFLLQAFAEEWQDSFRHQRGQVQADGGAGGGLSDAPPAPAGS
ncbi:MAG TPA: hypothetical protein VGV38_02740 [Pyrinomonadaceae bacterium]|nr:hypothetical protein [Pyrinomonadaceae bacterium]